MLQRIHTQHIVKFGVDWCSGVSRIDEGKV